MTSGKKESATSPIVKPVVDRQGWTTVSKDVSTLFDDVASIVTHGGLRHYNSNTNNINNNHISDSDSSSGLSTPNDEEIHAPAAINVLQLAPGQPRSLSGVAMRSFLLGFILSLCLFSSLALAFMGISIWRAPFFISTLCLFHFLEYWTTARANPSKAKISSFLLTSNGAAYNIAHSCALFEMMLSFFYFPRKIIFSQEWLQKSLLLLGMILVIIGQVTRALAILTAGPSFSHLVAYEKSKSHILIKHGIYSVLRHPSYFGFFWWGIGTQLVCGNTICLVGYALVLFWFFKIRIRGEESLLVEFFGKEYEEYAQRTIVAIPGLDYKNTKKQKV
ncbi:Protein-S-isoprenylcysteine O-methyltransferase [Erysiphe neolycopersici]|uniref:Protein-S-isoprenylcysteine O-methyltransferase n=1 Tax=Erysiphe neolycopersici TaxID=212602 RepID=A0A420HVV6_9PEZI|nr:Protein-S-isoprenylcysteine O-methyltransferase [Erysiphe neolycopersici]